MAGRTSARKHGSSQLPEPDVTPEEIAASALRRSERIERIWRGLSMVYSHAGPMFLASWASREHSKSRSGLDVAKSA